MMARNEWAASQFGWHRRIKFIPVPKTFWVFGTFLFSLAENGCAVFVPTVPRLKPMVTGAAFSALPSVCALMGARSLRERYF